MILYFFLKERNMAKLDENYLDAIRNALYNTETTSKNSASVKSGKSSKIQKPTDLKLAHNSNGEDWMDQTKKRSKANNALVKSSKSSNIQKQTDLKLVHNANGEDWMDQIKTRSKAKRVTYSDANYCNSDTESGGKVSKIKIISTPFKKKSTREKTVTIITQKASSSRNNGTSTNFKKKGKKRPLSDSETTEVIVKKKKEKPTQMGVKLNFDDSIDTSSNLECKSKNKLKKKKKKTIIEKNLKVILTNLNLNVSSTLSTSKMISPSKLELSKNVSPEIILPLVKSQDDKDIKKKSKKTRGLSSEKLEGKRNLIVSLTKVTNKANNYDLNGENNLAATKCNTNNLNIMPLAVEAEAKPKKYNKKKKTRKYPSNDLEIDKPYISVLVDTNSSHIAPCTTEDAADFHLDEKVTVKNLKFKRFCNLFPPTHNEQLQRSKDTFEIPKKYFKISKNDEFGWGTEEAADLKLETNKTMFNLQTVQTSSNYPKPLNNNASSVLDKKRYTEKPKKQKKKKINILDVQVLSPSSKLAKICRVLENSSDDYDSNKSVMERPNHSELIHTEHSAPNESSKSSIKILNLKNGWKIVFLEHINQTIHFNGLCSLEVLNGEVEILGTSLNKNTGEKKVFSPRGTSLLFIRNTCKLHVDSKIELKQLVSEELLNKSHQNMSFKQHCAIILCKEIKELYIEFIESHISQIIFPETKGLGPRVDFELSGNWNRTQDSEEWEDLLENISEESKTVICGGKGVGKSTFLRYAANVLLKKFKKIRIIELDPGQSEFYPPGCISVATVDKDVLGPNYTHLQPADRLILSHINMGHNVMQYLKSIHHLLETVKLMEVLPTLVNFPGFTKGLGLDIGANTLKLLQPTLVLEIKSKNYNKNYKMDMTSENVNHFINTSKILDPQPTNILNYDFVKLESLSEKNEAWSLEARQAREICILSYFGKMMSESVRDLTSPAINMFSINITALTIATPEGKVISPLAINGSLVALCSAVPKNSELFISHGYGFVRGMDLDTDTLVLLTPEPIERLENVSHLVLSSVTTPPSLIMSAIGVKGHIPFVNVGDLVDFGQFTKRSYLPPKK